LRPAYAKVTVSAAFAAVDVVDDGYNLPSGCPRDPDDRASPEHPSSRLR
jgi:hypothetical protein